MHDNTVVLNLEDLDVCLDDIKEAEVREAIITFKTGTTED